MPRDHKHTTTNRTLIGERTDRSEPVSRRNAIKFSTITGLALLGVTDPVGATSSPSPPSNQEEDRTNLEKEPLVDNARMRLSWVSVDGISHLFGEFKAGPRKGEVYHVELGEGRAPPTVLPQENRSVEASSSDTQLSATAELNSVTASSHNYDHLVRNKHSFVQYYEGCNYYNDYEHIWAGWGFELTDPVDALSKNTLSGLIGFYLSGGWGFLAGIIAGTLLSLYSDNTFSVFASDADIVGPSVVEPRMDMLVSPEYDPEVGDGYGFATYYDHLGQDPVWIFL